MKLSVLESPETPTGATVSTRDMVSGFGAAVKARRQILHLSTAEIARRVATSQASISRVENEQRSPSLLLASKIASALGVGLDTLLADAVQLTHSIEVIGKESQRKPMFTTISPSCARGGKGEAWKLFLKDNYIAIGWCYERDLTGMNLEQEILPLLKRTAKGGDWDVADGNRCFPTFWKLCERGAMGCGDYIAVKNVNWGLYGVGKIISGYRYTLHKHFTGELGHYYDHYMDVEWIYTKYIKYSDLDFGNGPEKEVAWVPRGTMGQLYEEVPKYIRPYLGLQ